MVDPRMFTETTATPVELSLIGGMVCGHTVESPGTRHNRPTNGGSFGGTTEGADTGRVLNENAVPRTLIMRSTTRTVGFNFPFSPPEGLTSSDH